jgi:hypothetical protein
MRRTTCRACTGLARSVRAAVFASAAHEELSTKYTFVPGERVLSGPINAGFVPVSRRAQLSRIEDRRQAASASATRRGGSRTKNKRL